MCRRRRGTPVCHDTQFERGVRVRLREHAGFRTYDNFELGTSSHVESLTWDFLFIDFDNPQPAPAPTDDVNQWIVSFHADNAGVPGAQLASHTFDPADVTSTFLSQGSYGADGKTYNITSYRYAAGLPTDFLGLAGTTNWLSVFALSDAYTPVAAWRGGSGGLGPSTFQQQLGAGMVVTSARRSRRTVPSHWKGARLPSRPCFS